jgi:hypothetical protein
MRKEIAVVGHRQFLIAEPTPSFDRTGVALQEKCRGIFYLIALNMALPQGAGPVPAQQQVSRTGASVLRLGRCDRQDAPSELRLFQPSRNRALQNPGPAWAEPASGYDQHAPPPGIVRRRDKNSEFPMGFGLSHPVQIETCLDLVLTTL